MSEGKQMSDERARQLALKKKLLKAKTPPSELKKEKGDKTLNDSGKTPTGFRTGTTGKTKAQARREASKKKPSTAPRDRKEREPTPILGETVQVTLPPKATQPRSALTKPKVLYQDIIQGFYDKSGKLPTQTEQIKYLKSQGIEGAREFRPNSIGEALNRLAYVATETLGGGIREATLGLSGGMGVEKRPGGTYLQIAGGVATPSAADYLIGYGLSKLAPLKRGQKLVKKIENYVFPEKMWANKQIAAKAKKLFESTGPVGRPTTTELRKTKEVLDEVKLDEVEVFLGKGEAKLIKNLKKQLDKIDFSEPKKVIDLRTADLPVTDSWLKYRTALRKISVGPDDVEDVFTQAEKDLYNRVFKEDTRGVIDWTELRDVDKNTLRQIFEVVDEYKKDPSKWTAGAAQIPDEQLLYDDFIRKYGWDDDTYKFMLKEYPDLDPDLVVSILFNAPPESRKKIIEDVADYNLTKPIPGLTDDTPPIEDTTEDTTPDQPPTEDEEEDITPVSDQPDPEDTDTPSPQEPKPPQFEEEPPPDEPKDEPETTPPLKLSKQEQEKRRDINLSLYRGKKVLYEVKYNYRGGKTQRIGPFEARSLPDALGKAQRKRMSSKRLPNRIIVNMIGEKK